MKRFLKIFENDKSFEIILDHLKEIEKDLEVHIKYNCYHDEAIDKLKIRLLQNILEEIDKDKYEKIKKEFTYLD